MLPGIVTFILRSAAVGSVLGVLVAVALMLSDAAGLGTMIGESAAPMVPVILFCAGFSILFGSLYTGAAIMLLPNDANAEIWKSIRMEPVSKGD